MAVALNYAQEYSRALSQAFPYVLNFGALYNTPNNNVYRWINARTIEIPSISTTGRVNADRDTIVTAQRNFTNAWEPKALTNQRKWSTLVHPMDVDQTNLVASISNITRVFNDEQKFPEMDAYCVSKIYSDWIALGKTADTSSLSEQTVLSVFDNLMLKMDNDRVPVQGRILYCTHEVKKMLKNADKIYRSLDVESSADVINRVVNRLDEVEIVGVPATLMKTAYNFTQGWEPANGAKQIDMFLVHPTAVITPVSYTFAQLDEPSAGSEGKFIYFEESYEDVFILNKKAGAIQFHTTTPSDTYTAVENPTGNPSTSSYYEQIADVMSADYGKMVASTDITVVTGKTYFTKD